jgi:hypothetical protein
MRAVGKSHKLVQSPLRRDLAACYVKLVDVTMLPMK